jgi:glycosyltransferase involved in cell wall biosynthesis
MQLRRLVYLGNAFPPGVSALFPEIQPAGHLIETNLVHSLRPHFEVRSVGISGLDVDRLVASRPASPGLPNALNLVDRPPELWSRWRALGRLHRTYREWQAAGWSPDLIVACNFSPVYNAFIRRLARQSRRPYLVLYLADSDLLDVPLSRGRALRYRLKPFKWLDNEMADLYDACIAVSADTEARFRDRNLRWLWLPNGIDPARVRNPTVGLPTGPTTFGYFGHVGEVTGIRQLLEVFTASPRTAQLRVCCFGKARTQLAARFAGVSNVSFHGPFDPEGCVAFGTNCDVLVNPRPRMPCNRNNFPSKVFEYALTGRAVLSSQLSGADRILGPHAYYFDADDYPASLGRMLDVLATTPRTELRRRGVELQQRLRTHYCWGTQGERLVAFLRDCLDRASASEARAPFHPELSASAAASGVTSGFGAGADLAAPSTTSSYSLRDRR